MRTDVDEPPDSNNTNDSTIDRISEHHNRVTAEDVGIKADNVSVVYRNGTVALENATFEIPTSTICGLVGINGAGKSTLFKALMGFVPIASGSISLLNHPSASTLPKNTVAYVPQNEEVDWNFPVLVEDVVMMGRYGHMGILRRPKQADRVAVADALKRVNMSEFTQRQIGELSGGQKKRVFLARALAQQSKIILLDVLDYGTMESVFTQSNLQRAFGGTLRFHVLGPKQLHDDDDTRKVTVISDDERPVVLYGDDDAGQTAHGPGAENDDAPRD